MHFKKINGQTTNTRFSLVPGEPFDKTMVEDLLAKQEAKAPVWQIWVKLSQKLITLMGEEELLLL